MKKHKHSPARMSRAQADRCHALALAHGHEWAWAVRILCAPESELVGYEPAQRGDLVSRGCPVRPWPRDLGEARAAYDAWCAAYEDEGGLTGQGLRPPEPNSDGYARHRTGSGRLAWEVSPEGDVYLTIFRPLRPDGSIGQFGPIDALAIDEDGTEDGVRRCFGDRPRELAVLTAQVQGAEIIDLQEQGPALERHWESLLVALRALVSEAEIRAVSPILAALIDRPEPQR